MADARYKLGFVVVVLLALAVASLWLLRDDPQVGVSPIAEPRAPAPVAPAADARLAREAADRDRGEVPVAPPAVATAAVVDPLLAHVRGRCIDEAGAPLAGCTTKLDAWGRNSDHWQDPAPVATDENGRFDIAFAPPSGMQFGLDVQVDGRVPRTGRWGQLEPAQVVELGDFVLLRGFEVRGRVVDELGAPVARVGVSLQNLPLPLAPDMGANNSRSGWSAENGEFRIDVAIPPGTWSLDVRVDGVRLVAPDHVTVSERGADPVLVTVRRMPSIQGVVVDELGQPVKGVGVDAELNRSGRMASGRSRDDGVFTIYAVDAEPKPVKLRIGDPGPCEPPAVADERVWQWGSRDVRIEVRRALSCELVVVERNTGAPVTQFAVSCYGQRSTSSLQKNLRLSGEHAGGRVTIDRVWRGRNFLQVIPLDRALLPSARVEFEATEAGVPLQRVEVDRLFAAVVRVTAANGAPCVGSKVEVIAKGTDAFDSEAFAEDARSGNGGWSSQHPFHVLVSHATTGPDGRAAVFVPPDGTGLVVRATGEHPPAIVDPAQFQIGQDLVVVPLASGSIAGVVRLQGLDAGRLRIARHAGEPGPEANFEKEAPVQADGSFALPGLAPGRYQLRLSYAVPYRTEHWSSGGASPLGVPDVDVVVEAERETKVDIDATAIVPGTVRGRALINGSPAQPARVFLRAKRGATHGQFVPDQDGVFEATGLLPDRYQVGLVVGDFQAGEGDTMLEDNWFELGPGQQFAGDFAFVRRRLVITLLQADGKTPAANVNCTLRGEGVWLRDKTTGPDGRLVLDPAPSAALHVHVERIGKPLGPVQVPAGLASHEVTLTLPKAEGR